MYCQTMFGVSRDDMLIGLQTMEAEKLTHHAFYCPKCRRANRVERRKLELANPNWQETLKKMGKEAAVEEKPAAKSKAKASTAKKSTAAKSSAKTKKSTAKSAPKAKKTTSKAKTK
jgi:hypothetical protein